ncbi:hypothetical protein DSL64_00840 [Dyadobacter luteus]|jgi:methyl-accepting chemotaxis protein|uniref:Uncharacterized protein n=1 Tax=Dyadobacter luteus TaxID=2259619 RepID=A0A3D8YH32_9BACT|nr:hypothetical protein [Dyadobacter luteus]REA64133.1 hypothetical protein DSL64_00840 [Dyadobacter luteus]
MNNSEPGFGKKILSFFINEEEKTEKVIPAQQKTALPVPSSPGSPAPKNDIPQDERQKFIEHFVQLLEKANLPGPDYFEYKQALKSMDQLGLSEEKRFQAAWASFKAMANQSDTSILTTSANQYLAALDKDRAAFLKDAEKALNDRVGSLRDEHKKLQDGNTAMSQQIADLQKKIDDNNNRLGQISGEITEQSARINQNRDGFEQTYATFTEQIKTDLNHINTYLK